MADYCSAELSRFTNAASPRSDPWVAIGILAFAAVAEGISLYVALKQINRTRGERSLWHWFGATRRSELIIVFGENAAALAGLGVALIVVMLTIVTADPVYDAAGSVVIGVLLVVGTAEVRWSAKTIAATV